MIKLKVGAIIGLILAAIGIAARADGINVPFSFPATVCTNQFIRSIAVATGVGTCASVAIGSDVSGLGTGVATALGTNVGTAGAFVANGGVLGSPSSAGTIPAFTLGGTIAGGGNQINNVVIGTATPLAGNFTAVTATGAITSTSSGALSIQATGSRAADFGISLSLANTASGAHSWAVSSDGGGLVGAGNLVVYDATDGAVRMSIAPTTGVVSINQTLNIGAVASDAASTDNTLCISGTGRVLKGSGTLGICLGTSSARYKHDIVPMVGGLAEILALNPVNFFYRPGHGDGGAREQYGFIAEDVVKVVPKLVGLDDEGNPTSVDIVGMVPVLVRAVQELKAENLKLRADVEAAKTIRADVGKFGRSLAVKKQHRYAAK